MGTIRYICKTLTENAESIKWFATNGDIRFNAAKEVILQSRHKIRYDRYEPIEDKHTEIEEIRLISKLEQGCHLAGK